MPKNTKRIIPRENVKEVSRFKDTFNMDGHQVTFEVKVDLNTSKGTFTISPKITTLHVDTNNEKELDGFFSRMEGVVREAVSFAKGRRQEILLAMEEKGDPNQASIEDSIGAGASS